MERYNKYLVLKISDIEKYLSDDKQLKLDALATCIRLGRLNDGKHDQQYVCIAADWPMYEQVWSMVESFVDGKPNEIEHLTARVRELEEENARLKEIEQTNDTLLDQLGDKNAALLDEVASQKHCYAEAVAHYEKQLAASQAYAEQLRVAIDRVRSGAAALGLDRIFDIATEALALPHSTSALDAYVEQKVKEIIESHAPEGRNVTNAQHVEMRHKFLEQIATLTRQRDLSVEAITRAIDMVGHPDNITYLQQTLDAIKESEAMAQGEKGV